MILQMAQEFFSGGSHSPPLEGRGKATGRRPQVGRSTSGRLLPKGRKNVPCGIID